MDEKIRRMLGGLEFNELEKLKRDLDSGSFLMKHLVNLKINELQSSHRKLCASCNKGLDHKKEEVYTLLFGSNIQKKASFCGMDCLHDFLGALQTDRETALRKDIMKNQKIEESLKFQNPSDFTHFDKFD